MAEGRGDTPATFRVRDCTLIAQTTGYRALNLRELRQGLTHVPLSSIYHHFWGRFLLPLFDEPDYNNEFASWTQRALNEKGLAERLSAVNPAYFSDLEDLREELVDLIETHLDRSETIRTARKTEEFHFVESHILVFETGLELDGVPMMARHVARLSSGSIYYHFIDSRRRTRQCCDDFSLWIEELGESYLPLVQDLRAIDPYFQSLSELRDSMSATFAEHTGEVAA